MAARYNFGIEEEYFLANSTTRGTPRRTKPFHDAARARVATVERELLAAQVEVATSPTDSPASARAQLMELRAGLTETGREHGMLVLASGTQPLARWDRQSQTKKERYDWLMQQMQMLGQRNLVCGMHVHVEVPRPAERVDLMNRLLPFTPLLLALSASSPFWQGRDTGLAAYRLSVWGEMPRTGLPRPIRRRGRLRPLRRRHDPVRRHHRCKLPVVDPAAVDPLSNLGAARCR